MIDVVMTVWNTPEEWVAAAGASARCQLRDGDQLIVRFDEPRQGIGPASNAAIETSTAPLIARLDADDILMPDTLRVLSEYLDAHPHVDVVSGAMHYIRPDGSRFGQVAPPVMHASPKHLSRITHSGCMFRRDLWERVGGYPNMRAADWHFWERCEAAGAKFTVLPHFVIERRVHPDSYSFPHSKHLQHEYRKATR